MKKLLVFVLLATAPLAGKAAAADNASSRPTRMTAVAHHARHTPRHSPSVTPTPTPAAVAVAPVEAKHSWFYRLFHPRPKATPTPTPVIATPTPKPSPVKKVRKRTKPVAPKTTPARNAMTPDEASSTPTPSPIPKKSKTKRPAPPDTVNGLTEPAPFVPDGTAPPPHNAAQDSVHFRELKTRALEDKHVQELQSKSDNASEGDEQRKASEEYYHALFNKMRQLDPAAKERIDRTEAATLRRL